MSGTRQIGHAQVRGTQLSSLPLQATGRRLYEPALISTIPCPASPQSLQPARPWEKKKILCYCDRWGENLADTTCASAKYGETCRMERECRRFVGNLVFLFLSMTESSTAIYNKSLVSQYLSSRKGL
jgi:hypothetical protein